MPSSTRFARISTLVSLGALVGCASMNVQQTEREMMAAGFQMRLAQTPQQQVQLEAMPQRQIVTQDHEGKPFFVYADAKHCKCVYVGTERAYRRYTRISMVDNRLEERREIAEARASAAMDIDDFGPWAPWWY